MGTAVSKREYNYCLDFIKGIACICVVFMHCEFPGVLGTAFQCVSRFCVPFFFMVSGYYCYNGEENTTEEKTKRAIRKIKHLSEIILAAILIYSAFAIVRGGVIESITFTAIRNFILFNQPFIIAGQMWFLFALLYDYILYAVLDCLNLNKFTYACIPVLAILYILLAQVAHLAGVTVPNMIYRNFLIEGFCFFMLGNWIHCNQNKIRISNSSLVVIIFICTLLCFVERALVGRDFGVNIVTFPQVTAIFLYGVNNPKRFDGNLLQKIGTRLSMLVYLLHPAVWHTLEAIYVKCNLNNNIVALYLMPVFVLGLTLLCSFFYKEYLIKLIKKIEKRC